MAPNGPEKENYETVELGLAAEPASPLFCGLQLKYISLVTLALQNALLAVVMHYSRVSAPSSRAYSAAAAVLMNELLKGSISLAIAFARLDVSSPGEEVSPYRPSQIFLRFRRLGKEVFSADCWKLSIPAILYVIQNNLQYVAASNLEAATFQVTYQMKILTTAFFSVILLRKRLSASKWFALLLLAIGVAVVQIQSGSKGASTNHGMQPLKGFAAVAAACFTSGLAGVYFEKVLKNSPGDLWVRNVQLSLFSLLPALGPLLAAGDLRSGVLNFKPFENFGPWAWATVCIQVFGGLVTALVIKYSDNILKGFATSLSIIISSLASVALFNFKITFAFIVGSTVVLVATMLYSQPDGSSWSPSTRWRFGPCRRPALSRSSSALSSSTRRSFSACSSVHSSAPGTPIEESLPTFETFSDMDDKKGAGVGRNLMAAAAALSAGARNSLGLAGDELPQTIGMIRLPLSRTHSQVPSRSHTPAPSLRPSPSMPYLPVGRS